MAFTRKKIQRFDRRGHRGRFRSYLTFFRMNFPIELKIGIDNNQRGDVLEKQ